MSNFYGLPGRAGGTLNVLVVWATVEYAVGVLQVPLVIVCGHTDCGVMKGALNRAALGAYPSVHAWLS